MKKVILALFLFIFSFFVYAQRPGNEAMNEITSIQRVLLQASESVLVAENDLSQEIVHLQVDLITGPEYKYAFRTLHPGWTYTIYAEGQREMVLDTDLKIKVYADDTNEWYDVIADETTKFGAIVQINPPKALRYAIGVKAAKYKSGWEGAHYFFMIMHIKPNSSE